MRRAVLAASRTSGSAPSDRRCADSPRRAPSSSPSGASACTSRSLSSSRPDSRLAQDLPRPGHQARRRAGRARQDGVRDQGALVLLSLPRPHPRRPDLTLLSFSSRRAGRRATAASHGIRAASCSTRFCCRSSTRSTTSRSRRASSSSTTRARPTRSILTRLDERSLQCKAVFLRAPVWRSRALRTNLFLSIGLLVNPRPVGSF